MYENNENHNRRVRKMSNRGGEVEHSSIPLPTPEYIIKYSRVHRIAYPSTDAFGHHVLHQHVRQRLEVVREPTAVGRLVAFLLDQHGQQPRIGPAQAGNVGGRLGSDERATDQTRASSAAHVAGGGHVDSEHAASGVRRARLLQRYDTTYYTRAVAAKINRWSAEGGGAFGERRDRIL